MGPFVQKWLKMEDGRVNLKWRNHRSKTQEMKQKERERERAFDKVGEAEVD